MVISCTPIPTSRALGKHSRPSQQATLGRPEKPATSSKKFMQRRRRRRDNVFRSISIHAISPLIRKSPPPLSIPPLSFSSDDRSSSRITTSSPKPKMADATTRTSPDSTPRSDQASSSTSSKKASTGSRSNTRSPPSLPGQRQSIDFEWAGTTTARSCTRGGSSWKHLV